MNCVFCNDKLSCIKYDHNETHFFHCDECSVQFAFNNILILSIFFYIHRIGEVFVSNIDNQTIYSADIRQEPFYIENVARTDLTPTNVNEIYNDKYEKYLRTLILI